MSLYDEIKDDFRVSLRPDERMIDDLQSQLATSQARVSALEAERDALLEDKRRLIGALEPFAYWWRTSPNGLQQYGRSVPLAADPTDYPRDPRMATTGSLARAAEVMDAAQKESK